MKIRQNLDILVIKITNLLQFVFCAIILYEGCDSLNKIDELQKMIDNAYHIVFFGGAGVSTASGIKDFRGKNGLYREKDYPTDLPPEYMLSIDLFKSNPKMFFDFYKDKMNCLDAKPNVIHKYLAK